MTQATITKKVLLSALITMALYSSACTHGAEKENPRDNFRGITPERGYIIGGITDSSSTEQQMRQLKKSLETLERFRDSHKAEMNPKTLADMYKKMANIQKKIDSLSSISN